MAKKIIWSSRARKDLLKILEYWKHRNKNTQYSKKLFNLFENHLFTISQHPEIGKNTNIKSVKSKIVGNYLLLYKIKYSEIELITIWDNRRNPNDLNKMLRH